MCLPLILSFFQYGTSDVDTSQRPAKSLYQLLQEWVTDSDEMTAPPPSDSDETQDPGSTLARVLASCSDSSSNSPVLLNLCGDDDSD